MAKTEGKKSREKTSIFFAANLKFLIQSETLFVGRRGGIIEAGGINWAPSILLRRGSWKSKKESMKKLSLKRFSVGNQGVRARRRRLFEKIILEKT